MKRLSKAGIKESSAASQWSKFRLNKISFIKNKVTELVNGEGEQYKENKKYANKE